ncbi:MAG: tRNA 2-thiocytidine biosynthesis TtcA family protein [Desulfobacteraceae bacterium]|nr:tRNA 2-thiocytidine biosynthesis TtcA family protein [Desulfobacteraceae bacterium]
MENVIPKLPEEAKCKKCRARGVIRLPSHNTIFCRECFIAFCENGVARAMKKFDIPKGTELLVAVSGGKDSLALWDLLNRLGYATRGIHLDLGIEVFSEASCDAVSDFAALRGLSWTRYSLKENFGWNIEEIRFRIRRAICSICGTIKRQMLNRLAMKEGCEFLVSGHNLDDEAGRLLGNTLRHRTQYIEKQYPFLPAVPGMMPAKAKPLYRLESHELRAYCCFASIRPHGERCPLSRGATSHIVKDALDVLEQKMPGTKRDFYFTYLKNRQAPRSEEREIAICKTCGEPAYMETCSVCTIRAQLLAGRDGGRVEGEDA